MLVALTPTIKQTKQYTQQALGRISTCTHPELHILANTLETLVCHETHDFMIFYEFLLLDCYDTFSSAAYFLFSDQTFGHFSRKQKTKKCPEQPEIRKERLRSSLV